MLTLVFFWVWGIMFFMFMQEALGLSFFVFERLVGFGDFRHGVSLRQQSIGDQPVDFDMSRAENGLLFCRALDFLPEQLVRCGQVHGAAIGVVEKGGEVIGETDGLCTRVPGVGLMLLGADCPLILVYDPVALAVGVAHAGWRGTVERICEKLVATMVERLGCRRDEMIAGIGPGISRSYYEVGVEVAHKVTRQLPDASEILHPSSTEKDRWHLDLIQANRHQLIRAGLRPENIEESGYCTYRDHEQFFSYRREGKRAGRWGLLAGLKESDG
jgi:YfiH family protein